VSTRGAALGPRSVRSSPEAFEFLFELEFPSLEIADLSPIGRRMVHLGPDLIIQVSMFTHELAHPRFDGHSRLLCSGKRMLTQRSAAVASKLVSLLSAVALRPCGAARFGAGAALYSAPGSWLVARFGVARRMARLDEYEKQALRSRLLELREEHRALDAAIFALQDGPADQLQLARLKKKKLSLRDQMSWIEDQIEPDIIA
jgi:hypothetical protein